MRAITVLAVSLAIAAVRADWVPTAVVQTATGPVQGYYNDASGVNMYKGIPYATPPVGSLRFQAPQPAPAWSSVLNASSFAPGCMSICPPTGFPKAGLMCTPTVSEDCLYLNVYAPANLTSPLRPLPKGHEASANGLLPVIFWIHGGNYQYGSGGVNLYDGQQMVRTQHVILVTINYRLGLFGALYTGSVHGNFQTKDQQLAMQWTQANIAAFGGDPARVTIAGQSAGAFSVATHVTLPSSAGLFQNAIIVSNPFTLLAADPVGAMQLGTKVLEGLNCPQDGGDLELACLRSADPQLLLNLSQTTKYALTGTSFLSEMMPWVPVVDGTFLPYQPLDAFERGNFTKVPIMFGTVANESVEFIWDISAKPMSAIEVGVLIDVIFGSDYAKNITELYGPIPLAQWSDAHVYLEVIATDYIFYCANRKVGEWMSKLTPTYMYFFNYLSWINEWVFGKTMPYCVDAVCHAQDLNYIFWPYQWVQQYPGEPLPAPHKEALFADLVQGAWGAFAYTGNPDPLGVGLPASAIVNGTAFERFDFAQNNVVNYSIPTSNLVGYRNDYCDFWDKVGYRTRR
jgi:carboxylesterase type B